MISISNSTVFAQSTSLPESLKSILLSHKIATHISTTCQAGILASTACGAATRAGTACEEVTHASTAREAAMHAGTACEGTAHASTTSEEATHAAGQGMARAPPPVSALPSTSSSVRP